MAAVLWGLAAFLVCPFLPFAELLIPIQQTLLLLVPVIAACSIVGWKLGGRPALAVVWITLSVWMLLQPAGPPGSQYDLMVRGWAILLAASFGLVSLWSATMPFFSRALFSIGLAAGVGFLIALSSPSGIARFQRAAGEELTRRASSTISKIEDGRSTPEWAIARGKSARAGSTVRRLRDADAGSAAGCCVATAGTRGAGVARRVGTRLGRLSETLAGAYRAAPQPADRVHLQRSAGVGAGRWRHALPAAGVRRGTECRLQPAALFRRLYLIRGVGILGWMAKGRYVYVVILSFLPQVFVIVTLALGLGDTWLDLRKRAKAG